MSWDDSFTVRDPEKFDFILSVHRFIIRHDGIYVTTRKWVHPTQIMKWVK